MIEVRQRFSGSDVASVLTEMGYKPVDRTGSHLKLRYVHPESEEVRNVTVPIGHEISGNTLRKIAEQCGAEDFHAWCEWIDEHR